MSRPLTVRDLRLHWPEAERRLRREGEIVVTRDGKPVAKLSAWPSEDIARPRWSGERHLTWLRKTWKGKHPGPSTDEMLSTDRGAR